MSLLLLLVGCIVDPPPFPSFTAETGATEETGTPNASGDTAPTGDSTLTPTGDTAVGPPGWVTSASCYGPVGASAFTQLSTITSFPVVGTVARWPDPSDVALVAMRPQTPAQPPTLPPHMYSIWFDREERVETTEDLPNVRVLATGWDGSQGYIAAHDARNLQVWNLDGSVVGGAAVPASCRTLADVSHDLLLAHLITDVPGLQVLQGCRETGSETSLTYTADLQATTSGAFPMLTSAPAVTFPGGSSGDIAGHLRNLAPREDGSLWLADDGDDASPGDVQRAVLLPPSANPYDIENRYVTEVVSYAKFQQATAPAMRVDVADVDGDGLDDLLVAFTAVDGTGELWIRTRQEEPGPGVLGRGEMDYVILPPEGAMLPGPFAVLRHDDGRTLVLASDDGSSSRLHWIQSLPPLETSGPIVLAADTAATVNLLVDATGDFDGRPYDMTHAGDLDGDGCDDLVLHLRGAFKEFGQGEAHVLSGE